MSVPVPPERVADALADFDAGYLLTTCPDGRVKVVTVEPEVSGSTVRLERPGTGSARNIAANSTVSLVFWPRERHGYSLIVDGEASGDARQITVAVSSAVLHRPAEHADGPPLSGQRSGDGCENDCRPLT